MANLVTSEEIQPLIKPVLSDANIINIKDTTGILEYRIESDDRAIDREKVVLKIKDYYQKSENCKNHKFFVQVNTGNELQKNGLEIKHQK